MINGLVNFLVCNLMTKTKEIRDKRSDYCIIMITLDEGSRLRSQLAQMQDHIQNVDLIISDGDSSDGSTELSFLQKMNVRTLLVTKQRGLAVAIRAGLSYALEQDYRGIICIDSNGKDGVEAISRFTSKLDEGYDLVQGSRFMKGGIHKNTPFERYVGIRYVLAPLLWLGGGCYFSDPTNGFRAYSTKFLRDKRVEPLRDVFIDFNIQHYLNYRAAKLKFKLIEIPVTRVYPEGKEVPTKITSFKLKFQVLYEMVLTILGAYNPK